MYTVVLDIQRVVGGLLLHAVHHLRVAPDSGQRDEPLVAELAEVALVGADVLPDADARSMLYHSG